METERLQQKKLANSLLNKSVSVVIPCRNEEKKISYCLDSLIHCDYPKDLLEIIVIDGASTDQTGAILKKFSSEYPYIKVLNNPHIITPVSMNMGIRNAQNYYIMIASSHSSFPANYISVLAHSIDLLQADAVGGVLCTEVIDRNKKTLSIVQVLSHKLGVGNSMFRVGVEKPTLVDTVPFGLYKKELFAKTGLYDERLVRNHDIELSKRILAAGGKVYLLPQVQCTYYARENYCALAKNNYLNGLWNVLTVFYTKNFRSLSVRHFVPLVFILSIIIPFFFSFLSFSFIWCSVFSLLVYIVATVFFSIKISTKQTSISYVLFTFWTLHFSYGLGSLVGIVNGLKLLWKK